MALTSRLQCLSIRSKMDLMTRPRPHPTGSERFFDSLPVVECFESLIEASYYTPAPSDWRLILTDIRGSTRAIRSGRYKDVNTLGAASIAVVRKSLSGIPFPYVFGGDGATLLVPESCAGSALAALGGLRALALDQFQLELRVGSIAISELEKLGAGVEVARYLISQHCIGAALRGEGLRIAEERIKQPSSLLEYRSPEMSEPDLSGLSCRWKPFQTERGRIIALIVEARSDSGKDPQATYSRVLQKLSRLFPDGFEEANPARNGLRGYRMFRQNLRDERRLHRSVFSFGFVLRALEILLAGFLFNHRIPLPALRSYVQDTPRHCDFRKMDSAFRAVLDCSREQIRQIEEILFSEHRSGTLYFGIHESDQSLMTCLVEGLAPGEHMHFIDADGGGYAAAALRLKDQKQGSPGRNSPGTSKS